MYSLTVCNLFYFYFFLLPIPFIHWCRTTIFHLHIGGEGVFCVRAFVCCLCIVFGECCAVGCNRKCISTVNSKHSEQYSFCVPNKTTHIHNVVSRTFFFSIRFCSHSVMPTVIHLQVSNSSWHIFHSVGKSKTQ